MDLSMEEASHKIFEATDGLQSLLIGPVTSGENSIYSWADACKDTILPNHGTG